MTLLWLILLTTLATYALRIFPVLVFRKPFREPHIVAFIEMLPCTLLAAMTIPDIFSSTGDVLSATSGAIIAAALAMANQSLPVVAGVAAAVAVVLHVFV